MARAIKQPSEKLTFVYEFADDLGDATLAGMPIGGTPVSVPRGAGANLAVDGGPTVGQTSVIVKWTGGVDGESYLTTVKMADTAGNEHERDGEIFVVEKAFTLPEGITSRYLTADEYVERYGFAETVRITDEDKTGTVDKAKLETALKDVTDEADAYIGTRYTTPLVATPRVVKSIVGALVRERLHKSRPTPEVTAAAERARQQLRDIASGRMTLPVEQGDAAPVIGGNNYATTSGDSSTTFRDAVAGFSLAAGTPFANWRQ
jgi:phage gp36-like protein